MSDNQQISNPANLRKWRHELPNLYDDARLTPYEYRLLGHYVRVGNCYESTRTTSEICCMSLGQVVATRKSLQKKGFVKLGESERGTINVTVIDRWEENFKIYNERSSSEHKKQVCSSPEQRRSPHERERSPGEPKKKPIKKEPIKNKDAPPPANKSDNNKPKKPSPEDEIRKFAEDKFKELTGCPVPKAKTEAAALWWSPLREICELAEWDRAKITAIMGRSLDQLTGLTVSSPKSILKTARAVVGEMTTGRRDPGKPETDAEWLARNIGTTGGKK